MGKGNTDEDLGPRITRGLGGPPETNMVFSALLCFLEIYVLTEFVDSSRIYMNCVHEFALMLQCILCM